MTERIEKVKNFNQYLLAIAGVLGIVFICLVMLFMLGDVVQRYFNNPVEADRGVLSSEKTDALLQDSLRRQIVSFPSISVIDSISATYLLPVSQSNLKVAESTEESLNLFASESRQKSYAKDWNRTYNNLIVHYAPKSESDIVFDQRVSISDYQVHHKDELHYLVISACHTDTNEDGYMNHRDLQKLFVYNVSSRKIQEVNISDHHSIVELYHLPKSSKMVVRIGVDRNGNGEYDARKEPIITSIVDVANNRLKEIISSEQVQVLQDRLEGR